MNAFLSLGSITIDLLNIELARLLKKGLQSDPDIRRFAVIEHFINSSFALQGAPSREPRF